jgi:peptide/nickel transport system substrate-binding protein/oligopeptide transport system substrate-binding protein
VEFAEGARVFRIPLNTNPPTLDPVRISDTVSDAVARKIHAGLVRFGPDLQPLPDLAESWEYDAEKRNYTFHLRRGARFHNGREVTAWDAKYSWERLLDPRISKYMNLLELVEGAAEKIRGDGRVNESRGLEVLDSHTFRVTLTEPSPTFLLQIAMVNAAVVPREAVEAAEAAGSAFGRRPVGAGPFRLVRWSENSRLVLRKHEQYHGGPARLSGLVFKIVPVPRMRLEKVLKGEFEVSVVPFDELRSVEAEHADLLIKKPYLRTSYLGLTLQRPGAGGKSEATFLGRHLKVRQAINCAINREHICGTILQGRSRPAYSILPPGMPGHDPDLRAWTYDPARAKALLAEAGCPGGQGLESLVFLYANDPDVKKIVLAIHGDLTELGLKVELQSLEWAAYIERVDSRPPDLFLLSWVADYNDPDNFLYLLFHTKQWGDNNHVRYSNAAVDRLLDRGRATANHEERMRIYGEVERTILAELPWAVLENRTNILLVQPWVHGVRENLTALDSGPGLNYVDFSAIEMRR